MPAKEMKCNIVTMFKNIFTSTDIISTSTCLFCSWTHRIMLLTDKGHLFTFLMQKSDTLKSYRIYKVDSWFHYKSSYLLGFLYWKIFITHPYIFWGLKFWLSFMFLLIRSLYLYFINSSFPSGEGNGFLAAKEMNYLVIKTFGRDLVEFDSSRRIKRKEVSCKNHYNFFIFIYIVFNGNQICDTVG